MGAEFLNSFISNCSKPNNFVIEFCSREDTLEFVFFI